MEEWAERKLPVFSYPFFMSFVRVRSAREDNMKKAILTVSFGTSHLDTLEKTIGAIERELAEAFPDRTLYRAFTSGMVIEKLKLDHKLVIFRVEEAMEQMYRDGVREVLVQPTHIIHGLEYEKMRSQLAPYQERFSQVRIGAPLLEATKDYEEAAGLIIEDVRPGDGESLVRMGHGTEHHTNAAYPALDYTFWAKGYKNVIVGTVEGFPEMDEVLKKLKEQQTKRVLLMPFMVVAGDHARNDMAGEEPDSWKSVLENEGFQVTVQLDGLGSFPETGQLFVSHLDKAETIPKDNFIL